MTPLEHAQKIIRSFYFALPNNGYLVAGEESCSNNYNKAIICAIVHVKHILDMNTQHCWECGGGINIQYWKDTLKELEIIRQENDGK